MSLHQYCTRDLPIKLDGGNVANSKLFFELGNYKIAIDDVEWAVNIDSIPAFNVFRIHCEAWRALLRRRIHDYLDNGGDEVGLTDNNRRTTTTLPLPCNV